MELLDLPEVSPNGGLHDALDALVRLIEYQSPSMRGSILLLDDDGVTLRHGAAPNLPDAYNAAIDGLKIGPVMGSCGTAAFRRERVVVRDIATDPLWADFRGLALEHGLAACWSTPIFGRNGRLLGTFAMYYDEPRAPTPRDEALTATATLLGSNLIERSLAEAALSDREARFRFLAEAIPVQVWTARPDGMLDFVTQKVARYIGRPARELLGTGWTSAVHPDDVARAGARWAHSVATGETYDTEFRVRCAETGEYRWHLVRAHAQRGENGAIIGWFGTNTDIEDQKRVEAARDAAFDEAKRANVARARLMNTISHELRTPIGAIGGFVELLLMELRGPLTEPQRLDLERIQRNARHLHRLIDDLLLLAKLEAGQLPIRSRPMRLSDVLTSANAMVAPQLLAKSISYEVENVVPNLTVVADADRVQQIVINLVANAIKFTATGGAIRVTSDREADVARVRVADTGSGIAADMLEKIFEPFVQVEHDTRAANGTGLGLAISRELARRMSGELSVESTPGVGSTFTLTLPLPAVDELT